MPRRAIVCAVLAALAAVLPAATTPAEGAARKACAKRVACKGKAGAARVGVPLTWKRRATLPGGATPDPGGGRPGSGPEGPGTPGVPEPTRPGGSAPPPGPPPPPPPPLPTEDPRFVQVVPRDSDPDQWTLLLSRGTALAGPVSIELNNRFAEDPHDLKLQRGATGSMFEFDEVAAGASATKSFPLSAGNWKLWCSLRGHEAKGMVATLKVTAG